jgi:Protein of unknown function (DUF4236)
MSRRNLHGLRFQKRIKVFPGLHLNLSLSGIGVSAGGRGFHVGRTARRQNYVSAGIAGTGLSVRQYAPASRTWLQHHSTPRMSVWPLVMAIVMLAGLLLAAMR